MTTTFAVDRKDLRRTRWLEAAPAALVDGQVRLRIDRFALTSNNVTYGAFGDAMHYWDFFPTGDAATGCIPAWGFADVVESHAAGIEVGERFYGYLPMADEVVLEPECVGEVGFVDGAAHRRELPAVYNRYARCRADPLYRSEHEALVALLWPLFSTSFLIDDMLGEHAFFGARSVLISSASSKTAYGLGHRLAERRGAPGAPTTIGLTSRRSLDFTRGLGCYDDVVAYDELRSIPSDAPAVYVDMSGDAALRTAVHERWNDRLAYSCSVGGTHWQALGGGRGLAGPRPVLFFAPAQMTKRAGDWGVAVLQDRLAAAWTGFIERVTDAQRPWLRVVSGAGRGAVLETYTALLDGRVGADEGRILRL